MGSKRPRFSNNSITRGRLVSCGCWSTIPTSRERGIVRRVSNRLITCCICPRYPLLLSCSRRRWWFRGVCLVPLFLYNCACFLALVGIKGGRRFRWGLNDTSDIVIVGTGITGAFAAHFLKRGAAAKSSVLVLEAREACWGATGRVCPALLHDNKLGTY